MKEMNTPYIQIYSTMSKYLLTNVSGQMEFLWVENKYGSLHGAHLFKHRKKSGYFKGAGYTK